MFAMILRFRIYIMLEFVYGKYNFWIFLTAVLRAIV